MNTITIDARMINFTGIGTFLQNLIPFILRDFKVTLLGNPGEFEKFGWNQNYNILKMDSPIYSLSEQLELPRKIKYCDLYLSPHYNIPLLPVKAKKRLSVIHDVNHIVFQNRLNIIQRLYSKIMINSAVSKSDKVISVSEFSKAEIIKYTNCKEDKIEIIHCAVNKSQFSNKIEKTVLNKLKSDYSLPDKFGIFVGTGKHHKNLLNTLKAFEILNSQGKGYNLVIVGKKNSFQEVIEIQELIKKATIKNNIYFTGYLSDEYLSAIYQFAIFLIFPSYYEGFGLPPLEAMSCGCPVISSNTASLPEVCNDAALYVNPYDVSDISQKIDLLFNDLELQESLKVKGLQNIRRFSWEESYKKLKILINCLAASSR